MTSVARSHGLRIAASDDQMIIDLAPLQGLWTREQYLAMSEHSRHLLEYTDGAIEVLPMPTDKHQIISRFLLFALFAWVQRIGGTILYAPLRLQIRDGKFREPDLLLVCSADDPRRQNRYWLGADLVVEIVSPDDPERDTVEKRFDYAEAAIPEYWIVHPDDQTITVLTLFDDTYREHGVFRRGDTATSHLLDGFSISVDAVLDAR
jgi:Uma2 family endonuclease